ncbi:MAG: hypothetical protein AAGI45_12475 [Cyanobacteria bacterium P01_H01_bin.26]
MGSPVSGLSGKKPSAQSTPKAIAKTEQIMSLASVIEAYTQRLLAWEKPITPTVLKAIADEVGITAGELASISQTVQTHLARGLDYLELGQFEQAINELNQAKALEPVNLEVLHALADTYSQRYAQTNRGADKHQAMLIAKRCVQLSPGDKKALTLKKHLERVDAPQNITGSTKPNFFLLIFFLENIFTLARLSRRAKTKIAVLILFLQQPVTLPQLPGWVSLKTALVTGGIVSLGIGAVGVENLRAFSDPALSTLIPGWTAPEASGPVDIIPGGKFDPGPNIPVKFEHPGLLIEPKLSRLGEYDGEAYYKFYGAVINDSGQEVRKLNLKVEFLDGDGVAIATLNETTLTEGDAIIRHGDTRSFRLFHKITPELISVRVSVVEIEQVVGWVPRSPVS